MNEAILFLDDNPARQRWVNEYLARGVRLNIASTATGAILYLCHTDVQPYDVVYLDHDLEGEAFADESGANTGSEVVRWIVANRPVIGRVICHTLNGAAGGRMVAALQDAGYEAEYRSFLTMVNDQRRKETADE